MSNVVHQGGGGQGLPLDRRRYSASISKNLQVLFARNVGDLEAGLLLEPFDQLFRDRTLVPSIPLLLFAVSAEEGKAFRADRIVPQQIDEPGRSRLPQPRGPGLGAVIGHDRSDLRRNAETGRSPGRKV